MLVVRLVNKNLFPNFQLFEIDQTKMIEKSVVENHFCSIFIEYKKLFRDFNF